MATFTANLNVSTDLRLINLNWYQVYGYDSNVLVNANFAYNGKVYQDVAYVDAAAGGSNFELDLGGYGFTTNLSGVPTGGTVQGMLELDLSTQTARWAFEGVSVSLASI